jgi:uroporphyrinogen decarboxylase
MPAREHIFIKACRREHTERTPVWIMRQAGRYLPEYRKIREKTDFLTLCKTPELASEVTIQPVDIIGVDAAILFSDILVVPEAMGMLLEMIESKGPVFHQPIRNAAQVEKLSIPDIGDKLSFVMDAIKLTKERLNDRVPLIGFSGSPWTLASYMVEGKGSKDFKFIKSLIYSDPTLAHKLLDKLAQVVTEYLSSKIDAGCDAVQIFDTWAGVLTPQDFREFSLRYITQIVKGIKPKNIPIILFAKGAFHSLKQIAETGCDVVGLDWTMDIGLARTEIGNKVALQGNLDPTVLFAPQHIIETEVCSILSKFGYGNGHIFNLGHGILPDTPVENAKFFVNCIKELSVRYHQQKQESVINK